MLVYKEVGSNNINLWGEGYRTSTWLTDREVDEVLEYLEELYPEGIDGIELKDFFTFNRDKIAEILGYASWAELIEEDE